MFSGTRRTEQRHRLLETVLLHEFEEEILALDKETRKVVRQAIFDEFIAHCTPRMQEDLANMDRWETVKVDKDSIGLTRLIDQAM